MQVERLTIICACLQLAHAGILPLTVVKPNQQLEEFGYIEYQPNGTLVLRSTMENGTNYENLLLFKTILGAIRVTPGAKLNIKIYGEGVEHKFPPFLERLLQRVQSYFSIYKYTDTSRPLSLASVASGASATPAGPATSQTTFSSTISSTNAASNSNLIAELDDGLPSSTVGASASSPSPVYTEYLAIDDNEENEFIDISKQ